MANWPCILCCQVCQKPNLLVLVRLKCFHCFQLHGVTGRVKTVSLWSQRQSVGIWWPLLTGLVRLTISFGHSFNLSPVNLEGPGTTGWQIVFALTRISLSSLKSGRPIVSEAHQITCWGSPHPPIICSLFARVTPRVMVERDLKYCFTVICKGMVILSEVVRDNISISRIQWK